MTKILVPVDYSDQSLRVLELAADIARERNGELTVLHVWETMPRFSETMLLTTPSGPLLLNDFVHENACREMKEFISRAKMGENVKLETRVDSGSAASTILDWISKHSYDLVIVGTHGRSGLMHWVLGSVAERIVQRSPIPVLTVPQPRPGARTAFRAGLVEGTAANQ